MSTQRYETDLTDEQFALLAPFLPRPPRTGRPRADLRAVLNGIFYLLRTGCQWRLLPTDFPPRSTVHTGYRRWRRDGTWQKIQEALRQAVRRQARRNPAPRTSAVDSQSVKTTAQGGVAGYDGGKKVKGRKRHIGVDSLGLLLAVTVTGADVSDGAAACELLHPRLWEELPRRETVYADNSYRAHCLHEEVFAYSTFRLFIGSRPAGANGLVKLPPRWVVERTFAGLGRARRRAKEVETLPESRGAMIQVCRIHRMLRRRAPSTASQTSPFRYAS